MDRMVARSEMYYAAWYYLAVDVFIVALQAISLLGNGFIIYLFLTSSRLKRNIALRLVLTLAITDWLFAFTAIPYMIHYLVFWNTVEFDYNGIVVVSLSLPLTIQFKINLVLTSAIGIDRFQAMRWPLYYRKKRHDRYVHGTIILGLLLAAVDVFFQFYLDPLKQNLGCAAVGCFTSLKFRIYWGFSNMALNVVMLALTIIVAFELKRIGRKTTTYDGSMSKSEAKSLAQANRLSMGILLISVVFLMIPSTFVAVADLFGFETFNRIGPFYIFGLLFAGVSNSILYITLHVELRAAARRVFCRPAAGASAFTTTNSHVPLGPPSAIFSRASVVA